MAITTGPAAPGINFSHMPDGRNGAGDQDLISQLKKWNDSRYWALSFTDVHEVTQARDTSLPCSIKKSLRERLDCSKTFILVVGRDTLSLTKGGCRYCASHSSYRGCGRGYSTDNRSFIEYECEYAAEHGLKVVVLYNYRSVDKSKCPASLRYTGKHIPAFYRAQDGKDYWDYDGIRAAIES